MIPWFPLELNPSGNFSLERFFVASTCGIIIARRSEWYKPWV